MADSQSSVLQGAAVPGRHAREYPEPAGEDLTRIWVDESRRNHHPLLGVWADGIAAEQPVLERQSRTVAMATVEAENTRLLGNGFVPFYPQTILEDNHELA